MSMTGRTRWGACRGSRLFLRAPRRLRPVVAHGVLLESDVWPRVGPTGCSLRSGQTATRTPAQQPDEEPLGVDDDAGDLAGGDHLGRCAAETLRAATVKRCSRRRRTTPTAVTSTCGPTGAGTRCSSSIAGADAGVARRAASGSIAAQVAASHQASRRGVPSTGRSAGAERRRGVVVGDGERAGVALSSLTRHPGLQVEAEGDQRDAGSGRPVQLRASGANPSRS